MKAREIMDLVHSDRVSTNLILLQAQDAEEMRGKQNSMWKDFVVNRQNKLDHYHKQLPDHPFYGPKLEGNTPIYDLYLAEVGPQHEAFHEHTKEMYRAFAEGMAELDKLLVLPYALGDTVSTADLHIVPWLSHAMWGAGGKDVQDFAPLEKLIGKSVPGFEVGARIKELWSNMSKRKAFQQVFPELH